MGFGFLPNVDEQAVGGVSPHHDAFNDIATADILDLPHHLIEQLAHIFFWGHLLSLLFSSHSFNFPVKESGRFIICNDFRLVKPRTSHETP